MKYKGIIRVEFDLDEPYDPAYMDPGEEYLSKLADGVYDKDQVYNDCVISIFSELEKSADAGTSDGQVYKNISR